jgi:hypothetical protein
MWLLRPRLALVLGAAVALLAGCGGTSKAPRAQGYVQQVVAVASGLDSVTNDLYTPTDASSAASELATLQTALRKAASQLAAITPPPAVKAEHERLVRAVNALATGVTPVIAKLKAGNLSAVGAAFALRSAGDARRAIAAIDAAGYAIRFPLLG